MKYSIIYLTLITIQTVCSNGQAPAEHLIPPPVPQIQQKYPKTLQTPQFIPLHVDVPNGPIVQQNIQPLTESPGFMQRVARWFGYGDSNNQPNAITSERPKDSQQQSQQASFYQPQYKEAPQAFQYHRPKANCNPCNKVPWLPMFQYPGGNYPVQVSIPNQFFHQQYPAQQQIQQGSVTNPQFIQQLPKYVPDFHSPNTHVQRAVKFNYPASSNQNFQLLTQQQLTPIPVPNLSATPIPPLYNAVPFRQGNIPNKYSIQKFVPHNDEGYLQNLKQKQLQYQQQQQHQQHNHHHQQQQQQQQQNLQHFEHIGQPSEHKNVLPTQIPANDIHDELQSNPNIIEIVQSVPVTDFITSIEYPAKIIQSELIDLSKNSNQDQHLDQNSEQKIEQNNENPKLIELGSYEPQPTQNHLQSDIKVHPLNYQPEYLSKPIIVHNQNTPIDNYVEASSHNISIRHENKWNIGNHHLNALENHLPTVQPREIFLPTQLPPYETPATFRPEFYQEQTRHTTSGDFKASAKTPFFRPDVLKKDRETPKRLLDSPILYNHNTIDNHNAMFGSSPRPFTRDPSELRIGGSASSFIQSPSTTQTPWASSPTPTSTYSSIDASGQWAGISPPAKFQSNYDTISTKTRSKQIQQIIIPYTTKNQPQPFKVRQTSPSHENQYSDWSNSHEHSDFHEEQESKLVTATQITDVPTKKTTKYLTKILAANIRDLLRREHDVKNKSKLYGVDLMKLRKNIDDWTEQEYSSLSDKLSTVSIRGRSKHIPNEYLTTTPSLRETKIIKTFTTELPTTNNMQTFLFNSNELYSHSIEDNNIGQLDTSNEIDKVTKILTSDLTTTLRTTTTTPVPSTQQQSFYIRNVKLPNENEVWQKVKVSISPLTKEKVYVVTPQPRFQMKSSTSNDGIGTFKSPRFLIRPTPASNSGSSSSSSSSGSSSNSGSSNQNSSSSSSENQSKLSPYSPELFGLMGISAYIPAAPVDVLDGHSRVITVVTPTPHTKKRSIDDVQRRNLTTKKTLISSDNKS